ncbi:hypothetical protein EG68_01326 [Paragonimus skrjabini miyazakii]|uniref:EGF-like domain-containing protein n=1 Tax=Paragonimus skrjabini miyazakii TaxID=59628 RepID=A0A8S9Z205_9TREM|nr:hypothetical protein EG68_01326 [Paragonimus skrjabini miyazakii]
MPTYNNCPPSNQEYCYNGGDCLYLSEDPTVYICSCFMPYYGPRCEHEAPRPGAVESRHSKDDSEAVVKRSVDRAITITALVFIVVTFLGLLVLAWYLSKRRQRDYAQWKNIKPTTLPDDRPVQTAEFGIQVSLDDSHEQRKSMSFLGPYAQEKKTDSETQQETSSTPSRAHSPIASSQQDLPTKDDGIEERRDSIDRLEYYATLPNIRQSLKEKSHPSTTSFDSHTKDFNQPDAIDQTCQPVRTSQRRKQRKSNHMDPSFSSSSIDDKAALVDHSIPTSEDTVLSQNVEPDKSDNAPASRQKNTRNMERTKAPTTSDVNLVVDPTDLAIVQTLASCTLDDDEAFPKNRGQNNGRCHTLTHVGRASAVRNVFGHTQCHYVNAQEVWDVLQPPPTAARTLGVNYPNYRHTLEMGHFPRYHDPDYLRDRFNRRTAGTEYWTPHMNQPFSVASQHDALLLELMNRGRDGTAQLPGSEPNATSPHSPRT